MGVPERQRTLVLAAKAECNAAAVDDYASESMVWKPRAARLYRGPGASSADCTLWAEFFELPRDPQYRRTAEGHPHQAGREAIRGPHGMDARTNEHGRDAAMLIWEEGLATFGEAFAARNCVEVLLAAVAGRPTRGLAGVVNAGTDDEGKA